MKKMKLFLGAFAFLAVGLLFTACNPETRVTIKITGDSTAYQGDTVKFSVQLTPDIKGELGDVSVTDNGSFKKDTSLNGTSTVTLNYEYVVPANADTSKLISIVVTAIDGKSGESNTETFNIKVSVKPPSYPEMLSVENKEAEYNSNNVDGSSWLLTLGADGTSISGRQNTDADLAFVAHSSYGPTLTSPNCPYIKELLWYNSNNYNLDNYQETKLQLVTTKIDFDALDEESINELSVDNPGTINSTYGTGYGYHNVEAGQIYIFETADGRKGAIRIDAASGSNDKYYGRFTYDVKYQKTPASSGK